MYEVADDSDGCATLACIGGVMGTCSKMQSLGAHKTVVCACPKPGQDRPFAKAPEPVCVGPPENIVVEESRNTGGYGGTCMCPDGQTYDVGDNQDGCASLACVGGTSGSCVKDQIPGIRRLRVECACPTDREITNRTRAEWMRPPTILVPNKDAHHKAMECRKDTICRCKIFGKCWHGMTTAPSDRYPLHRPEYYCQTYALCGATLPEHLQWGSPTRLIARKPASEQSPMNP
jgi:hypothetical protein